MLGFPASETHRRPSSPTPGPCGHYNRKAAAFQTGPTEQVEWLAHPRHAGTGTSRCVRFRRSGSTPRRGDSRIAPTNFRPEGCPLTLAPSPLGRGRRGGWRRCAPIKEAQRPSQSGKEMLLCQNKAGMLLKTNGLRYKKSQKQTGNKAAINLKQTAECSPGSTRQVAEPEARNGFGHFIGGRA